MDDETEYHGGERSYSSTLTRISAKVNKGKLTKDSPVDETLKQIKITQGGLRAGLYLH